MKVNTDQFALDTRWRKWKWSWFRRMPLHFFLNRLQWYAYPHFRHVPQFPIHVDFEVSSLCNLKCPMCYRPYRSDTRDGLMDFDVYRHGIDECADHGLYSIRLSWRGEPTLHPRLPQMVAYAKARGISEVSFITNGVKLTEELPEELVRAGLDYFSVSIDGLYDTYEKIRYPSKFPDILAKLRRMRELRDSIGRGFPRIRINSIWSAIKECREEYFSVFSPIVDFITINPDYDHSSEDTEVDTNHICQFLYQRMTVMWDGVVPLCICDKSREVVLGTLGKESLQEMWHGPAMQGVRQSQIEGRTNTIPPCRRCQRPVTPQIGDQRPRGGKG